MTLDGLPGWVMLADGKSGHPSQRAVGKKKKRRFRPGTRALMEVRKYQKGGGKTHYESPRNRVGRSRKASERKNRAKDILSEDQERTTPTKKAFK